MKAKEASPRGLRPPSPVSAMTIPGPLEVSRVRRGTVPVRFGVLRTCALAAFAIVVAAEGARAQVAGRAELREAREILRLGDGLDVPDWQAFQRVPRLMLDAWGRLHVMPSGDPRVRVLDERGGFIRYIGGKGEGPGEFQFMRAMGFVGDTLWIENWVAPRTSYFDSAGGHLRTAADPGGPNMGANARTTIPLAQGGALFIPPAAAGADPYERVRLPLMVGPLSGSRRDTLAFVLSHGSMMIEGLGYFAHSLVALPPLYRTLPSGSGVVVAEWDIERPGRVVLRRYDVKGALVSESAVGFRPRKISAEARKRYIDEGVAMVKRTAAALRETVGEQVPRDIEAAVIEGSILPGHWAPVSALFVTHEGRIWLREKAVPGEYEGEWIVVGPDGTVEFRVRPPPGVTFQAAHGDRVWGTGTTDLDVPYIALYELGPVGGAR